jgi:glycosyltransferase involved in cell wall biosynthesis
MIAKPHALVFSREYPPTTVGGTSTVARNLAVGLVKEGWMVTVVTTGPGSDTDLRERIDGVTVHRAATGVVYNSTTGLMDQSMRVHRRMHGAAERLTEQIGPPDIVALPDLFCFPEALMTARRHGAPLINILLQDFRAITPYDKDMHRVTNGVTAERAHLLNLERKALVDSDHTVFISAALSDDVTGHYGPEIGPSSVVHLGVDIDEIDRVRADDTRLRRRGDLLGTADGAPLVVAVGRLVPVKGFSELIFALGLLGEVPWRGSTALPHLALVGVGPEEQALRALADESGMTARVSFLGDVSRSVALGWMSIADVAVVPSLWESFCYVCAEMMAFERPVVCTAVDSLRELIPDDSYGYPVRISGESGSRVLAPADLADGLRRAFADPEAAARRGRSARTRVTERFINARFAHGIADLGVRLTGVRAGG